MLKIFLWAKKKHTLYVNLLLVSFKSCLREEFLLVLFFLLHKKIENKENNAVTEEV